MIFHQNLIKNTVLKQKNNLMIKGTVKKFDCLNGWGFIEDYEGTVVVPPGCEAHLDSMGNIVIKLLLN